MIARKYEEYIDRITRRRNHLSQRVSTSTRHLSYDEAELAALDWVLVMLHDNQALALDHLEKYLTDKEY